MRLGGTRQIALLAFALAFACLAAPALGATIKVNTTSDEYGTGAECSLREAITAANTDAAYGGCLAGSGADTIKLTGGQRYVRELPGTMGEDANAVGDYDITSDITIAVRGNGKADIDAGGLDRAIDILAGGKLTASNLEITNGDVFDNQPGNDTSGGGIADNGTLILSKSTIVKNEAPSNMNCTCGGGLSVEGASPVAKLDRVKLIQNKAENIGGGIAFLSGKLVVNHSTIGHNSAASGGGGVYLGGDVGTNTGTFHNSTISDNTDTSNSSNSGGGGVLVSNFTDSTFKFVNSTIADNSTAAYGGGIWEYSGGAALSASTVTGNTADANADATGSGGGLVGSDITATNSIVAGNSDLQPTAPEPDCFPGVSVSNGLLSPGGGCTSDHSRTSAHPGLRPLASNGGPTKTVALTKQSPAVDHAAKPAPARDQRGRKRDKHPDIGAYEYVQNHRHHHH